jgi:hypothetical protein
MQTPRTFATWWNAAAAASTTLAVILIHASRYAFKQEPTRVVAALDRDPEMKIDRLGSAILEFSGRSLDLHVQHAIDPLSADPFSGTRGRIELEIPFNAPPDRPHEAFHRQQRRSDWQRDHYRDLSRVRSIHVAR